ncbi:MAG: PKD domain-containing protein [Oceanihabitans sp.]
MNIKKLIFIVIQLFFISICYAQDYRYTNDQFSNVTVLEDVVYGTAPFVNTILGVESITTTQNLLMDIYLPDGDTNTLRPVIVFAHGGGFVIGNKQHDDMVALCETYAKKGYVTVSIDYRQGFFVLGNVNMHAIRAVYRGIQDGKTAVRFMRANAATYGVDSSKVYFVGSSAGSFIGLHGIYMDEANEKPSQAGIVNYTNATIPFFHTTPDLGPLDIGENLNKKGEADAVVSLWGAIQNTNLIKAQDTEPVLLVHGDSDIVVPFNSGPPFSIPLLDDVEGSNLIKNKLVALGATNNETYFVSGQGHEFYGVLNGAFIGSGGNAYWNIIVDKITAFLWKQHKPLANFASAETGLIVDFTDSSTGALSWLWDFGDGNTSTLQNPTHTYANAGTYNVKLYIENNILSWDEKVKTITPETLSTTTVNDLNFSYYPNPISNTLQLEFSKYHQNIDIQVYNTLGQLVKKDYFKNKLKIALNFENLSSSMYYLVIKTDTKLAQIKVWKQ